MPRVNSILMNEADLVSAIRSWHRGESLSAREQALIEEAMFQTHQRALVAALDRSSFAVDR